VQSSLPRFRMLQMLHAVITILIMKPHTKINLIPKVDPYREIVPNLIPKTNLQQKISERG
jgi:hypothetical protein